MGKRSRRDPEGPLSEVRPAVCLAAGQLLVGPYSDAQRNPAYALLRPLRIDSEARRVFDYGQCHALAAALHEWTGWPMVVLSESADLADWWHCVVRHPNGRYVGISGWLDESDWAHWEAVPIADVAELEPFAFKPDLVAARAFVPAVLEQLGESADLEREAA